MQRSVKHLESTTDLLKHLYDNSAPTTGDVSTTQHKLNHRLRVITCLELDCS